MRNFSKKFLQFTSFFNGKDIDKISSDVNKAAQKIKANADWMKNSFDRVNNWFDTLIESGETTTRTTRTTQTTSLISTTTIQSSTQRNILCFNIQSTRFSINYDYLKIELFAKIFVSQKIVILFRAFKFL